MAAPAVLYSKEGHVALVVMNRPEVHNALNAEMLVRLADAWQDINDDANIRAAILTGAGDDAFCAGADLDRLIGMVQGKRPPETDFDKRILDDFIIIYKGLMRSYDLVKPLIAAVRGFCIAGGTEILQTTDIRVASETSRFAIAEVKHSLFPMGGSTVRLPRQIPYCRAMEILLTGEQFSAAEALAWGLINKVVPDGEVMKEARRYADVVSENGPLAVQAVKRSVLAALGRPTVDGLQSEHELGVPVAMSADAKEGTKAFKEKRRAVFHGR
jgi:enoyl-CoA hydratase